MTDAARTTDNPLLAQSPTPAFDAIEPSNVAPAIEVLVARCETAIGELTQAGVPVDYATLERMLDVPVEDLHAAWGVVMHLTGVCDTPALRSAVAEMQPRVTALFGSIASDLRIHALTKRIRDTGDDELSAAQRRSLDISLRGFRLGGAELLPEAKERFVATRLQSANVERDFSNNVLDATDAFTRFATADELAGVPEDVLAAMARAATAAGRPGGYLVGLKQSVLGPVMVFAKGRTLREDLYRANVTRASEWGPGERDNTGLIAETLALRQERARMLGHASHAEVSLVSKMADSPRQVLDFLRDLARRARPHAIAELDELRDFARRELRLDELAAWDVAYASERLRQARYSFGEQEVRAYFNLETVLSGLFRIAEGLFDIRIRPDAIPGWHPLVRSYRVTRNDALVGQFLFDPYARSGKRGGAWMSGARNRWRKPDGMLRTAMAYVVTNFPEPAAGLSTLLAHQEVVTLFHEFGHALHFLLSAVEVAGVSGISGVEWDAVELPSQLMENFAWEWPILEQISGHASTGEPLPRELFGKMLAARRFQSGLMLLRQVELALFDMTIHADPQGASSVQAVMDAVRAEVSVAPPPDYNRFQNAFSHVFAGGYAAGYYSYLWAELLAADAWNQFVTAGVLDAAVGRRYRESILERGGSRPMVENFVEFVGRAPCIDALLHQRGLLETAL